VKNSRRELTRVIKSVDEEIVRVFDAAFTDVARNFSELFAMLFPGGSGRLVLTQQVREEDIARVRSVYDRLKIKCELAPFFTDLPARLASNHLIVSRSGASTVAELAAIGRPSILVPLPGSIDQDQFANAGVLADAGGAFRLAQRDFTPERLASEIAALAADPSRLAAMAQAAKSVGTLDAAERLADLVLKVAAR